STGRATKKGSGWGCRSRARSRCCTAAPSGSTRRWGAAPRSTCACRRASAARARLEADASLQAAERRREHRRHRRALAAAARLLGADDVGDGGGDAERGAADEHRGGRRRVRLPLCAVVAIGAGVRDRRRRRAAGIGEEGALRGRGVGDGAGAGEHGEIVVRAALERRIVLPGVDADAERGRAQHPAGDAEDAQRAAGMRVRRHRARRRWRGDGQLGGRWRLAVAAIEPRQLPLDAAAQCRVRRARQKAAVLRARFVEVAEVAVALGHVEQQLGIFPGHPRRLVLGECLRVPALRVQLEAGQEVPARPRRIRPCDAAHEKEKAEDCRPHVAPPPNATVTEAWGLRPRIMINMATLLIVDDEPNILTTLRRALELEGYNVEVAGSGRIALEKAKSRAFDGVLLDVAMPEMDGLATLKALRELRPELPVMMMSGNATLATAVEATKLGACDFLEKPLTTDKVLITVANALKLARLERDAEADRVERRRTFAHYLVGSSPRMKRIFDTIGKAAPSTGRVLITGERGTGKELIARAMHEGSRRKDGLFGHEKGAFTGATQQRRGKFEQAHGGTLFLDEIGDMDVGAQAKVLRVLQENEIERVGGNETITVDVRVIAATNKDLKAEIAKGRFRADLFDRLNVVPIEVPPLREHKEDVPSLVEHFLVEACAANGKRKLSIAPTAMSLLMQHDWPGNVRELRNHVERMVIFAGGNTIGDEDVQAALPGVKSVRARYQRGASLKDLVNSAEREIVLAALEANGHHIANTARELGLERSHLYKKMRALGIDHRALDGDEA